MYKASFLPAFPNGCNEICRKTWARSRRVRWKKGLVGKAKKGGNEEKQSKASPSDVPIKNLDLISGFLDSDGEFREGFRRSIMYGNCVQETLTVLFCSRQERPNFRGSEYSRRTGFFGPPQRALAHYKTNFFPQGSPAYEKGEGGKCQ